MATTTTECDPEIPNEVTAARAAKLWVDMLKNPSFDNNDRSINGIIAAGLASESAVRSLERIADQTFCDFASLLKGSILSKSASGLYTATYLSVDYEPCIVLDDAARNAGLNCRWPWKTSMHVDGDKVSVRQSGRPYIHHYHLENGQWLITTLAGSRDEMEQIKRYAMDNSKLPEFRVEHGDNSN